MNDQFSHSERSRGGPRRSRGRGAEENRAKGRSGPYFWVLVAFLITVTVPRIGEAGTATYDFSSGAGTDRWGYELEVSSKPPTANNVPSSETMTYGNISANDGTMESSEKNVNADARSMHLSSSKPRIAKTTTRS